MLNLASLQKDIWSVFGKDLPEDRASLLFTKKIFNSYSDPIFNFFRDLELFPCFPSLTLNVLQSILFRNVCKLFFQGWKTALFNLTG